MRIPYWGVFLILSTLFSTPTFAQEDDSNQEQDNKKKEKPVDKDVEKAYEAYDAREYTLAIELLKRALSDVSGREAKTEVLFKLAESYRNINEYKEAERNYQRAYKLGYKDPIAQLYYADMLKAQGEYEEAIEAYQDYKKANPTDPMGEIGIESTRQAIAWQNSPSLYQVSNMSGINTRYMDFSAIYGGDMRDNDVIIFASSREEATGSKEDGWTGETFMDLFTASAERKSRGRRPGRNEDDLLDVTELKWSVPVPIDEEDIVNTGFSEGTACFDSRKKTLYFTRCVREKDKKLGCSIWTTEQVGKSWRKPEPIIIGSDTSSNVGHPSLSPDDNHLYFVSTDYSSRGGRDIYVTTFDRRSKTWNSPKNLGPKVNTERDEYYPFAHNDGYLYFASNGLPGMGGLDIFRIKVGEDGMPLPDAKAENMQFPINTNWDDFHLVFEPGSDQRGFLSSNRKGGQGSDDIYAVFKTPLVFKLEGVVTNSKTLQPIPEATVKLDGSDGTSLETTADKDGYYIFEEEKIKKDVNYKLTFEKKKFITNTGDITTIGIPISAFEYLPSETKFIHTLRLNKALDPIEDPIVLPNVFFDLGKWDLRPEARNSLDSVVIIMNNNPTFVIELRSHTDYRDSDERNKILSQKRADTCVSYLASKGVAKDRMVPRGMGETEPFRISDNYNGYGSDKLPKNVTLTEKFIKTLTPEQQEVANQINRRTDFKVLRDDYVPAGGLNKPDAVNPADIIKQKEAEANAPGEIYIIKGRESFGVIARKNNIDIRTLKELNGGLRGVRPFEGLQLKVTPDGNYEEWDATHYKIERRGQDFKDIARKLDIDKNTLEELNPDVDDRDLQPGFWVRTK
ncbi:MAG: OmpA family protein [Owenweeksia sp.]